VRYYNAPPNVADIAKNVSLLGFALVPPTWSIRVELFASAAIPFISLAIRRGLGLGLLGGSTVLSIALQNTHQSRIVAFLLGNLGYLPCFVLGAVALRYQDRFGRLFGKPSALALSAAILLLFRRLDASWRFDVGYTAITPMLVESLAAAILIIGVVAHPIPLLQRRLVVRLGDISYSLYLIHFIVMSALAKLIGGLSINEDVRAMLLMMVTLAVCWPLSAISYSYIEKPGIWVGRMLANTLSGTYLRSRPRL
jgi:peptidoglycan/LPS O-acetylase OafA/YrhL